MANSAKEENIIRVEAFAEPSAVERSLRSPADDGERERNAVKRPRHHEVNGYSQVTILF